MFARAAFRPVPAFRTATRQYSSKTPQQPLQAASPWGRLLLAGGAGFAAYYAYAQYGGDLLGVKKTPLDPPADAAKVFTGGDQGFVPLRLVDVEHVSGNTKRLRFAFEDEKAVSGLHVASALLTKFKAPDSEKPVTRPYTPISDELTTGYLDLLVKKYPNGPMSSHLHDMTPGQTLEFKGPLPKYPWTENKHEHIALLAGGTGITPMYQLIRAIFGNTSDKTKVTLVFGNVKEEDILLKKDLKELENTFPDRFRAFYVLDNPPKDSKVYQGGFITKELLKQVLPPPDKGEAVKVFVCGPPAMYKAISGGKKSPADQGELTGILKELGYSKDQVYKF